jgi:imidazole glycerol-phosphate synthase subunit HisF
MLKTRIIPCLLLKETSLIKTVRFGKFGYIGDPANTVRIFNELEVDELVFLDVRATKEGRGPNFKILHEIADECFMPLTYGGGIKTIKDIRTIFNIGLEKVAINSYAFEHPDFIKEASEIFGSQSILVSIDVKKNIWGKYEVYTESGTRNTKRDPVEYAHEMERCGAGELLLTSIDREGTWSGFDVELIHAVTSAVKIPVIANGGAGNLEHIEKVVEDGHASAVALGSMVVYQAKGLGVLVNFPDRVELNKALS